MTAQQQGADIICAFCNVIQKFELDKTTHSCSCSEGYSLDVETCLETCGDGRVIEAECDDGNLVNGDGCSS